MSDCDRCGKEIFVVGADVECFGKTWHKQCFRCCVCDTVLTLETYKAYKSLPYCHKHFPSMRPLTSFGFSRKMVVRMEKSKALEKKSISHVASKEHTRPLARSSGLDIGSRRVSAPIRPMLPLIGNTTPKKLSISSIKSNQSKPVRVEAAKLQKDDSVEFVGEVVRSAPVPEKEVHQRHSGGARKKKMGNLSGILVFTSSPKRREKVALRMQEKEKPTPVEEELPQVQEKEKMLPLEEEGTEAQEKFVPLEEKALLVKETKPMSMPRGDEPPPAQRKKPTSLEKEDPKARKKGAPVPLEQKKPSPPTPEVIDLTRSQKQQRRPPPRKARKTDLPRIIIPDRTPEKKAPAPPVISPNDSIFNESFDQLKRPEPPVGEVVVRKKAERRKLQGHDCVCCEKYYDALDLSPESRAKRVNEVSRHRNTYRPYKRVKTPEYFWETDFPNTEELLRRGCFKRTF